MGQLPDNMTLWDLRDMCLRRVMHLLTPDIRDISRHFWYNERMLLYREQRMLLRDITAASSVVLELRPDYYRVRVGRQSPQLFAIDPELPVAAVIEHCLGQAEAWRCHELAVRGGPTLAIERSLWEQGILPSLKTPLQKQPELVLRQKRSIKIWKVALLAVALGLGFAIGYLIR
ncbi:hypothetical protein HRbin15_02383 [bacterium HR15]|nr:hypothetical protein HRbin15_02383 [bacterium HR15]